MKSLLRRLVYGQPVIVVSGLPRSGTSLAMQMLAAGGVTILSDAVRAADDDNPRGYYEFEPVKSLEAGGDANWLANARGKAVKIVSPLLTHLPESYDYRVVFMRRNLDEVIASQNAMLDARQEPRGVGDERLRAHYDEHLRQVERFLARRRCFAVLTVHYEDVLSSPRDQAVRMDAFVGGGLDVSRMQAVADPTLYRQRRPPRRP